MASTTGGHIRADFADLMQLKNYWKGVITESEYETPPSDFMKIMDVVDAEGQDVKFTETEGFGAFTTSSEYSDTLNWDKILAAYNRTLTPDTYSKYFEISVELLEDEQWGVLDKRGAMIKSAESDTYGIAVASALTNAFTTTTSDGQYFIDTDHPYVDGSGSTISNKLASGGQLNVSNFNSLYNQMVYSSDRRGKKKRVNPKYLVIPPALEDQAKKILYKGYQMGSADYTHNVAGDKGVEIVVIDWLTSTTAWFLCQSPKGFSHPLKFIKRKSLTTVMDKDVKKNGALQVSNYMRFKVGYVGFRGIAGSTGA